MAKPEHEFFPVEKVEYTICPGDDPKIKERILAKDPDRDPFGISDDLTRLGGRHGPSGTPPDGGEGAVDGSHAGPGYLYPCVAPWFLSSGRVANPIARNAYARHEPAAAVHSNDLAMVSADPPQRGRCPRRVIAAHLDAGGAQARPVRPAGLVETAEPVIEESDDDPRTSPGN